MPKPFKFTNPDAALRWLHQNYRVNFRLSPRHDYGSTVYFEYFTLYVSPKDDEHHFDWSASGQGRSARKVLLDVANLVYGGAR